MVFTFNCRQGNSNMIDIYKHINDIDISMGETKRMNCPVCNGYKTFTITNNMGQKLWNCYKASCSVGGSMKVNLSVDEIKQKYLDDVYIVYNESNSELERHIKFNDHHKFKKLYNARGSGCSWRI